MLDLSYLLELILHLRRQAKCHSHTGMIPQRCGGRFLGRPDRLTKVYMSPDTEFPAPKGPGYIVRYSVERIGGVGPWVPASH
jgi:hypothetical protein